jgi:hypothetical protein
MKKIMTLAPLAALAVGGLLADQAAAITSCASGNLDPGIDRPVQCPGPGGFSGFISGNTIIKRVISNLSFGAQLDVVGRNNTNGAVTPTCSARDKTPDGQGVPSAPNSCVPNDPGEIFAKLHFDLYRP